MIAAGQVQKLTSLTANQLREWSHRRNLIPPDVEVGGQGRPALYTWQTVLLLRLAVVLRESFRIELQGNKELLHALRDLFAGAPFPTLRGCVLALRAMERGEILPEGMVRVDHGDQDTLFLHLDPHLDVLEAEFHTSGDVTSSRKAFRKVAEGNLWIGELDAIWSYLEDAPTLGQTVDIFRGIKWRSRHKGVFDEPSPMRERGIYKSADSLVPFQLKNTVWLNTDPDHNLRPEPLSRPWESPKVIINNQRTSCGPWRLMAAADDSGLWASQQFTGLWPTGSYDIYSLSAVLNNPLANAFVTEHSTDHHFTNAMLAKLPLPRSLNTEQLIHAVREYQVALNKYHRSLLADKESNEELNRLLLWIDALVLKGYDLPPRLEHQLLAFFDGRKRPVKHNFQRWIPEATNGFVPLYERLTRSDSSNRGPWVLDVFKSVPNDENDAISRFIA